MAGVKPSRKPFLSLFFCLALAVNLLAPFASASPLFVEICSGHETRLVLVGDASDPVGCEICTVCCTSMLASGAWATPTLNDRVVICHDSVSHGQTTASLTHPKARAPPVPTV